MIRFMVVMRLTCLRVTHTLIYFPELLDDVTSEHCRLLSPVSLPMARRRACFRCPLTPVRLPIRAVVKLGYAPAAAVALRSADRNVREASLGFLLELARHVVSSPTAPSGARTAVAALPLQSAGTVIVAARAVDKSERKAFSIVPTG